MKFVLSNKDLLPKVRPAASYKGSGRKRASSKLSIQRKLAGEQNLSENIQKKMENSFGRSFSDVRVHANSDSATKVGALAYTQGSNIHFAPGQYNPGSSAGQKLIGHELTHVVQQRDGRVSPTTEVAGLPVNDSLSLEAEAEAMGNRVS